MQRHMLRGMLGANDTCGPQAASSARPPTRTLRQELAKLDREERVQARGSGRRRLRARLRLGRPGDYLRGSGEEPLYLAGSVYLL